mmetsp:Transcript_25404/g.64439  ORF Transcript_25404/g.64439 Transcript_25404/m.64439 type:complete len:258 (+) Transcript_25404:3951-4724(+)
MTTETATLQRVYRGTLSLTDTVMVLDMQGNLELCDMSFVLSTGSTTYIGLLSATPRVSIDVETMGMPLAAMLMSRAGDWLIEGLKTVNLMMWRASLMAAVLFCVVPPLGRQQSFSFPAPILKATRSITSCDSGACAPGAGMAAVVQVPLRVVSPSRLPAVKPVCVKRSVLTSRSLVPSDLRVLSLMAPRMREMVILGLIGDAPLSQYEMVSGMGTLVVMVSVIVFCAQGYLDDWPISLRIKAPGQTFMGHASARIAP